MRRGEVILRSPLRDDGYWALVLLATVGMWLGLEKAGLPREIPMAAASVLVLAAAALRLTALRRWHRYNLPWSLDDETLTVGDRAMPVEEIRSVRLKKGMLIPGSLHLVIRGEQVLRLSALARGMEQARSVQSLRELGWAVQEAVEGRSGKT